MQIQKWILICFSKPQTDAGSEPSNVESYGQELSAINPFQEITKASESEAEEKITETTPSPPIDSTEVLDFDVKDEIKLDNPAAEPVVESLPSKIHW